MKAIIGMMCVVGLTTVCGDIVAGQIIQAVEHVVFTTFSVGSLSAVVDYI